jgi:hypothetical protein
MYLHLLTIKEKLFSFTLFLLSLTIPTTNASATEKTIKVTVTGFGATTEEAEKNALQKAVRKALGELVDAETITNNEEIIKDQVLSYSDGFVESKKIISGPEKDPDLGVFSITMEAKVIPKKVTEKLQEVKIAVTEVSGEDIWAQSISKVQGIEDGRALLKKMLWEEMHPERLLVARLVSKTRDGQILRGPEARPIQKTNYDEGTVELTLHIETFYHLEAYYKQLAPKLIQLFDKLCNRKLENATPIQIGGPKRGRENPFSLITEHPIIHTENYGGHALRLKISSKSNSTLSFAKNWTLPIGEKLPENVMYVACNVGRDRNGHNQRFAIYEFDAEAYSSIFIMAQANILPPLNLIVEDEQGGIIRHEKWYAKERDAKFSDDTFVYMEEYLIGIRDLQNKYKAAYNLNASPSTGFMHLSSSNNNPRCYCITITPYFPLRNYLSDAPVFERKITLQQEDVKSIKKVKVFFEGIGQPNPKAK